MRYLVPQRDGDSYDLRYVRDKEGREVDFAIIKNGVVERLIEAKWADAEASTSLRYYAERLRPVQALQVVANLRRSYSTNQLHVQDAKAALVTL